MARQQRVQSILVLLSLASTLTLQQYVFPANSGAQSVGGQYTNTQMTDCNYQLDVVIAIDSSNSMFQRNFDIERNAISDLVSKLNISPLDINVGLVVFSGTVTSYPLSGSKPEIMNNIQRLPYLDDSTRTDLAINEAYNLFRNARGGNVRKLLIIVTDGWATYHQQAVQAATRAKSSGIIIYTVGVTDAIKEQELKTLASSPQNVFFSANFQALQNDLIKATNKACKAVTMPTTPPPVPTNCNYQLDLVIAIDSSNSMYESNFNIQRQAIANLINNLHISDRDIRVGLVLFSGTVSSYTLSGNPQQVLYNLNNMKYLDDSTRTDLAINEAITLFRGARGGSVNKLLIIITDGRATYHKQAVQAATNAKNMGISIYAVGVTDAMDVEELKILASTPQNVFLSANFQNLRTDLLQAANKACQVMTTPAPRTTPVPTTPRPTVVECNYQLDVVFAIDSSNSMYEKNFKIQQQALTNVISDLHITPYDIHVGLVVFSDTVSSYPSNGLSGNKQEALRDISNIPYLDGSTRTDLAINEAYRLFSSPGARNVRKLLIIVTDGRATYHDRAVQAAYNTRSQNISIYAVGVGDAIDQAELRQLASSPQQVLFSSDFQHLSNDLVKAANRACRTVTPTNYGR